MTSFKRQFLLCAAMLVLLLFASLWSIHRLVVACAAAQSAANDLTACGQLANSIELLRNKPRIASEHDMSVEMLGRRITDAAQKAGLDSQSLQGIFPQSARRVNNSPYLQKPTDLSLRNVTLPQLVSFLYYLTEGDSGLVASDLRLRAPREPSASNAWDVETTIICLIYEPPSAVGHRQP